ncbi:MAG TPA: hypothetical protein VL284_09375 [Thermoanaerobaculia bacterium]|nr:hypothetical protein [Thermoanaerobaculia bacterium]
MFIGHNAVAFAAKRVAPRASLGVLMAAAMLVDLIWPILLMLGVEHVRIVPGITRFTPLDFYDYPWTHSLVMGIGWAVLFAGGYWAISHYGRGAIVAGFCVLSHWVLDFIVHRPDLPLVPGGGPKVGLGIWNSPGATVTIEWAMFILAILIYRDATKPRDRTGSIAFWALVILLGLLYLASATGTPPPNVRVLEWMALSGWIVPFWAAWFDRHREATV